MTSLYEALTNYPRHDVRWIGLEIERFGYRSGQYMTYQGGWRAILERLVAERAWKETYKPEGNLLGIEKSFHQISLEPGSQFEISLAPCQSVLEIERHQKLLDIEIAQMAPGLEWLCVGVHPKNRVNEVGLLPSPRYRLMDQYYQSHGQRGQEMMRLTTGLHINLDYANEEEALSVLRNALRIEPYLATLFSNSRIQYGKETGHVSERHMIWQVHDALRSGFLDAAFERDFSLQKYCRYIEDVPMMYAFDEQGQVFDPKGLSFSRLPESLKKINSISALRQMFFEVRLKPCCVEVRYLDQQPDTTRYAATAMMVGLLYDEESRESIEDRWGLIQAVELRELSREGACLGLKSDRIFQELSFLLGLAEAGLRRRGFKEEKYLEVVESMISARLTTSEMFKIDSAWL